MSSPTLIIADYPVGYASGFGETLFNLFSGFPDEQLWSAHPGHLFAATEKRRGYSVSLPSPRRPRVLPNRLALTYYPFLKAHQSWAAKRSVRTLRTIVEQHSIRNLLVIPVTPWILSAAISLHKQCPKLNLVLFVMDDWQGHHESHRLPYSRRRRELLREAVNRANTRFAVSREMAAHYEEVYRNTWQVAHNAISSDSIATPNGETSRRNQVLLAGDINEFRFDAVLAFAEAIERYNLSNKRSIEFVVLGEVAEQHRVPLSLLDAVTLQARQPHSVCLEAMRAADLLYLPLAFSSCSARISRYSMPTKLPEYLATGKPVLFHAPFESALFQVAERYDLNPRLATVEPRALDDFIERWQTAPECVADRFSKASAALAKEFDINVLSSSFQSAFN
jgi:hypothetical protein